MIRPSQPQNPILTIAIPTYQRAPFLEICLTEIFAQLNQDDKVEVLVSDNASEDRTAKVVSKFTEAGAQITYIRNHHNIGSDKNIAQCFTKASGKFVLILGDDDVLMSGSIAKIMAVLNTSDYGVVSLRPFGYDHNFNSERPATLFKGTKRYDDPNKFIKKIFIYSTLISANVINKSAILHIDATKFVGTKLVQTYLILAAALAGRNNAYLPEYLVACKRNNTGGYNVFEVFSDAFNKALTAFLHDGLSVQTIRAVNRRLIWFFFPQYIYQARLRPHPTIIAAATFMPLFSTFRNYMSFWICLAPLLKLPRIIAIPYAAVLIGVTRIIKGDLIRLIKFAWSGITR